MQALELLREISPGYMELLEEFYDLGFNGSHMDLHNEVLHYYIKIYNILIICNKKKQWVNPLLNPLPQASMRVFCMYGVGKPTEYSYPIKKDIYKKEMIDERKILLSPFTLIDIAS